VNLEKGLKLAEDRGILFEDVVKIEANRVIVKLTEKGGKEYSFFNDVKAEPYPDEVDGKKNGIYFLAISKK